MSQELKPEILAIADTLKKGASIDANNKVVFAPDAFKNSMPDGLTEKVVRAVDHHKQNFAIAMGVVVGELGMEHLKKNKEVKEIEGTVSLPVGKAYATLQREVVQRNMQTGEPVTKHGHVAVRIITKVPGSQLTALRAKMSTMADKFGIK